MALIDATFTQLMSDMQSLSKREEDYLRGGAAQRYWMIPTNAATFDPLDIPNLGTAFDRTNVNAQYAAEYTGSGDDEIRTVMGTNLQIGYMAMMERAWRDRHKTATRAWCHQAGRKKAHGDASNNVHQNSVQAHVQKVLNA